MNFDPCPPSKCAVLVPVAQFIEPACEAALQELERRGYVVRRIRGYADIALGRSQMASDALADGFEETMWIDADTGFRAADVDRLRSHPHGIVAGIYPKKGRRELAVHVFPETERIVFGPQGGLVEVRYAPTGFLLIRRAVYDAVRERHALPTCRAETGRTLVPYFTPLVHPDGDGWWYLAEDFAFCERARQCGFAIWADSTIRIWHIGTYAYGWEDAGGGAKRYRNFQFRLTKPGESASADGGVR